jgi:hypothetical protein
MEKNITALEKTIVLLQAQFRDLRLRQSPIFKFSRGISLEMNTALWNCHCQSNLKRNHWDAPVSLDKIVVILERENVTCRKQCSSGENRAILEENRAWIQKH